MGTPDVALVEGMNRLHLYATDIGELLDEDAEEEFQELGDFNADQLRTLVTKMKIDQRQLGENKYSVWNFVKYWCNLPSHRKKPRSLVKIVEKSVKREDIGDILRKYLPWGTAGPRTDEREKFVNVSFSTRQKLVQALSIARDDGKDYKGVADKLGYSNLEIQTFERSKHPMEDVFKSWEPRADATFGKLYDVLVELGMTEFASWI